MSTMIRVRSGSQCSSSPGGLTAGPTSELPITGIRKSFPEPKSQIVRPSSPAPMVPNVRDPFVDALHVLCVVDLSTGAATFRGIDATS